MYQLCITIGGKKHCFPLPTLVDRQYIHKPPPPNFPQLDLAISVLELVAVVPESDFSKELSHSANRFIDEVRKGLPAGTELVAEERAARKAA
jgi:hypothetical protein